jgi:hypothetical protein
MQVRRGIARNSRPDPVVKAKVTADAPSRRRAVSRFQAQIFAQDQLNDEQGPTVSRASQKTSGFRKGDLSFFPRNLRLGPPRPRVRRALLATSTEDLFIFSPLIHSAERALQ